MAAAQAQPDVAPRVARFLDALADEIAITAREIADLGRILSANSALGDRQARHRRMEAFLLLKEKCATNAVLVRLAAVKLQHARADAVSQLAVAVESSTSGPTRERLLAALRLEQSPARSARTQRS